MAKLYEEILKLTNPTPVFKDPEDNSDDETTAKIVDHEESQYVESSAPSKLRQKNAIILGDTDRRYAGKKISRKAMEEDDDDVGLEEEDSNGEDDDDNDDDDDDVDMSDKDGYTFDDDGDDDDDDDESQSDEADENDKNVAKMLNKLQAKEFSFQDDGDYSKYADDDDDDGYDDEDGSNDDDDEQEDMNGNDDDDDDNDDDDNQDDDDEDEGFQKFSSGASDEVAKGQAAKQQLGLWDSFLEGRIKLQKALSIVNQLPQKNTYQQFCDQSKEFNDESKKVQEAFTHLLGSLVHLQDLLLYQNKETRNLESVTQSKKRKSTNKDINDDDDEEITSESEDDDNDGLIEKPPNPSLKRRKLDLEGFSEALKKQHQDFMSYRDTTIQKWFDKTRLATGKMKGKSFSAFDQSAVLQINQILSDKERLIKRSQLKRSVYRVLGTQPKETSPEVANIEQEEENIGSKEQLKDYDEEIFDDDDFYHQILRELIEKKTADVNDPVALSRQWLTIQKLRSKTKRNVDTRASKGRKIRYNIHKKLVNFMAPNDTCVWTHEARDELFKSLFGKRFQSVNV